MRPATARRARALPHSVTKAPAVPLAAVSPDLHWTLSPGPILLILLLSGLYGVRFVRVRREPRTRPPELWRAACFALAMLGLVAALVSPIDAMGEQLFFMHMVQHVILLDVVPVLTMLSLTKALLRPVTRAVSQLERQVGYLAHPIAAVALYVGVMWLWHIPTLYDAATRHIGVHVVEHLCFTFVGFLYWWHLLSPIRARMSQGPFGPVMYMLGTKLLVGILGIGITFAPNPLYSFYTDLAARGGLPFGISALDDQAVAGAIMATEQSVVMGIALAWLFVRALSESERDDQRAEALEARSA